MIIPPITTTDPMGVMKNVSSHIWTALSPVTNSLKRAQISAARIIHASSNASIASTMNFICAQMPAEGASAIFITASTHVVKLKWTRMPLPARKPALIHWFPAWTGTTHVSIVVKMSTKSATRGAASTSSAIRIAWSIIANAKRVALKQSVEQYSLHVKSQNRY